MTNILPIISRAMQKARDRDSIRADDIGDQIIAGWIKPQTFRQIAARFSGIRILRQHFAGSRDAFQLSIRRRPIIDADAIPDLG